MNLVFMAPMHHPERVARLRSRLGLKSGPSALQSYRVSGNPYFLPFPETCDIQRGLKPWVNATQKEILGLNA